MTPLPIPIAFVADRLRATAGASTQAIFLFGSYADGTHGVSSDMDLLLVVEPPSGPWVPEDNLRLRQRCLLALRDAKVRPDLFVRTTAQYADASRVFGGVEYWAREANQAVYWRPPVRHFALSQDLEPTRRRLSDEVLMYARMMLAGATSGGERQSRRVSRAFELGVLAAAIHHSSREQRKGDSLPAMLRVLRRLDAPLGAAVSAALRVEGSRDAALTTAGVRLALGLIGTAIAAH
jgi:predicted nucleotidyltransferase